MTIHVLIGLKPLAKAKQRLIPALSPTHRKVLMLRMLEVVVTAARTADIGPVWLASSEPTAPLIAKRLNVACVSDGELPWNEGLVHALNCLPPPVSSVLYLAGDLPLLKADDLLRFVAESPLSGVGVARARDGGSNALLVRPSGAMPPMFGEPQSSTAHELAALRRGLAVSVVDLERVALDVDTIADARDAGLLPGSDVTA